MGKTIYSAPKLEQVRMEAEMPVICASGTPEPPATKSIGGTLQSVANW